MHITTGQIALLWLAKMGCVVCKSEGVMNLLWASCVVWCGMMVLGGCRANAVDEWSNVDPDISQVLDVNSNKDVDADADVDGSVDVDADAGVDASVDVDADMDMTGVFDPHNHPHWTAELVQVACEEPAKRKACRVLGVQCGLHALSSCSTGVKQLRCGMCGGNKLCTDDFLCQ